MSRPPADRSPSPPATPVVTYPAWRIRESSLDLSRVRIMGVVNVTPDSFSDGGRCLDAAAAIDRAVALADEGADLIDIGAESSRPGAVPVSAEEELRRLRPVLQGAIPRLRVPVSVDTMKATVAARALADGAAVINDVSALRDPDMASIVADARAGLVLMHMKGSPETMQALAQYDDVVEEVRDALHARLKVATEHRIDLDRILLDPGIGFGKNLQQNVTLLRRLRELLVLGRPLLVGVSRKAFIGRILDRPVDQRRMGTAAAVAVAVINGARVIRVHDVADMRDVVRVVETIVTSVPEPVEEPPSDSSTH